MELLLNAGQLGLRELIAVFDRRTRGGPRAAPQEENVDLPVHQTLVRGECRRSRSHERIKHDPAGGECSSGDQISAAHQSGNFKDIGTIGFGQTKSFDMNKFLCGNPQPGTIFRVEFRGDQGRCKRGIVYDYPFPRGDGCHGYYCFVTVTL